MQPGKAYSIYQNFGESLVAIIADQKKSFDSSLCEEPSMFQGALSMSNQLCTFNFV